MSAIVTRGDVDQALLDMVTAASGGKFAVGLNDLPPSPSTKYALILPMPTGRAAFGPPLNAPESILGLEYSVVSVGADNRQAAWVADQVRGILCDRDDHGVLVTDLAVTDHYVLDRAQVGPPGGVQLIEGVYQAHDAYLMTVGRS